MSPRPPLPIGQHGEISLKRVGESWAATTRHRDPDGATRAVQARGRTRTAARDALLGKLAQRSTTDGDITGETRLKALCELWVTTHDVSHGSKDTYASVMRRHVLPRLGDLRLREVTTARADAFLQSLSDRPATARHARAVLSMVMGMAARYDAVPANPITATSQPRARRAEVVALTPEQVHALHQHVVEWAQRDRPGPRQNPALLDLLEVLSGTGMRPGEALALRWCDVDVATRTVHIQGTVKRLSEVGLVRQDRPKSDTSRRSLTVPVFVAEALRRRRASSPNAFGDGLVFTSRTGGLWDPSNVDRLWRDARKGGFEHVTFRSLRKAVATLLERELGESAAAAQLGHSSPEVTRRHYIERRHGAAHDAALDVFKSS